MVIDNVFTFSLSDSFVVSEFEKGNESKFFSQMIE